MKILVYFTFNYSLNVWLKSGTLEKQGLEFNTSHSDTEVVLLGLSFFGIDYVKNFIGQFSIVFIDYKTKTVSLIRDRLGQKPLFFKKTADFLTFSSNLKSLVVLD